MAKFTLFVVHGIGVHRDSSWADETIAMLEQTWDQNVRLSTPLDQHTRGGSDYL